MPLTPKQMIKLLEQHGFIFLRSNGSHRIYRHPESGKQVVVPFHVKDLKPGLESVILKQAGLK